jgi:hypothetical protein
MGVEQGAHAAVAHLLGAGADEPELSVRGQARQKLLAARQHGGDARRVVVGARRVRRERPLEHGEHAKRQQRADGEPDQPEQPALGPERRRGGDDTRGPQQALGQRKGPRRGRRDAAPPQVRGEALDEAAREDPPRPGGVDVGREHQAAARPLGAGARRYVQRIARAEQSAEAAHATALLASKRQQRQPGQQQPGNAANPAAEGAEPEVQGQRRARGRARGHGSPHDLLETDLAHPGLYALRCLVLQGAPRHPAGQLREQAHPVEGADLALQGLLLALSTTGLVRHRLRLRHPRHCCVCITRGGRLLPRGRRPRRQGG